MIPLRLSLQGLYSYKEKQTIDFRTLTDARLFGIFGNVGSGKSSILEAMMFVLYDNSGRLNKSNDNRYYNMLNLQSDEMLIDFEFLSGRSSKETYRFVFRAKRKPKDFEKVEVKERTYYQWKNEDWLPLEGIKDATEIIGMNYDNFRQTVIIPQGKFREFIDQTPAHRTRMLQEIFQLDQFDLSAKTGKLLSDSKLKISSLEGRLTEVGEVREEDIQELEKEFAEQLKVLEELTTKLKQLRQEDEQLKSLQKLFEQLKKAEQNLKTLDCQAKEYAKKAEELAWHEKARTFFREILQHQRENSRILEQKQHRLNGLKKQLIEHKEGLEKAKLAYQAAKASLEQKEDISLAIEDLKNIIGLRQIAQERKMLLEQVGNNKKAFEKQLQSREEDIKKVKELEAAINEAERNVPDVAALHAVAGWHTQKNTLLKDQEEAAQIFEEYQKQQKVFEGQQKELVEKSGHGSFEGTKDFGAFFEKAASLKKTLENRGEELQNQLQGLKVKQEISNFAAQLKEGEPCQLCGSEHHPEPARHQAVADDIAVTDQQLKEMRKEYLSLQELEQQMNRLHSDFNVIVTQKERQLKRVAELKKQVEDHEQAFVWEGFNTITHEEIAQQLKMAETSQKELREKKTILNELRLNSDEQEKVLEQLKDKYQQEEKNALILATRFEQISGQLKKLSFEKFEDWEINKLEERLNLGESKLRQLDEQFEKAEKALNEAQNLESRWQGELSAEMENLFALEQQAHKISDEIEKRRQEHGFESIVKIQQLLQAGLDIDLEKKRIESYNQEVHTSRELLKNLREETEGKTYDTEKHEALQQEMSQLEVQVKDMEQASAVKKREISEWQKRLQNARELLKELQQWQERKENLQELSQLFRGSGFVNYVSSVYLQNLCQAANERFMVLTRNSLSLELNESNEFIVRDYLNNGKTRLLKTLSGGQTFQAALCLALSLAEHVKALNQADQSFFFLDEGFGALDKDSLRVVFDTLKSLRKENRIAGIISHVEELQQEIDVYLKVENDKEKGSLVNVSWE